jgi:predicted CXXCH cytochrome family protein
VTCSTRCAALLLFVIATACERRETAPTAEPAPPTARSETAEARFVGSARCASCHLPEMDAWRTSHHAQAMQAAEGGALLGDFSGVALAAGGATTRFLHRGEHDYVNATGPDGVARDYEVRFTFGVDPLQQLLVPLDRGRLQATTVAWDARPRAAGGQRWFALHGDERIAPDDPLHWTQLAQRWNTMCAECHSTGVRKGYDAAADRFDTTWAEISVGCEACHGPGARHVAWAEATAAGRTDDAPARGLVVPFADDGATWVLAPGARIAARSVPRTSHAELDACGSCHARRSIITATYEFGRSLLDTHLPSLLDTDLYAADGQIHDEVYEWGSFLQSRMYAKGVTCSDCHEPHGARLRAEGNALCTQCHRADVFDAPAHHHHAAASAAARCTACHMPTRTYMAIDQRHDHSLRVPRPDLSERFGTPNACNMCHADRKPKWAADAVARWYGESRRREAHYGEAFAAARSGAANAEAALVAVASDGEQPAIVRATALGELAAWLGPASAPVVAHGAADPDPLVRVGAVRGAQGAAPAERLALLAPLLRDPVRAVRIETADALVAVPADEWAPGARDALVEPLAEWRAAQQANADRPESHVNLGALHARLGERDAARAEYEAALRLGPWFVPAYLNLADLLRQEGRDDEGERLLRRALEIAPDSADAHHALGLLLARRHELAPAIDELRRAAELAPANAHYAYVYAVALHSSGDTAQAIATLEAVQRRRPGEREIAQGLAELREAGAR